MNSCFIRVLGDDFNPAEVLNDFGFAPAAMFRRGEIRPGRKKPSETGGFTLEIGKGSLSQQIDIAAAFLRQRGAELRRLSTISTVESFFLEFTYDCRLGRTESIIQRDLLPIDLIRMAADTGLSICITLVTPACDG